MQGGEGEEQNLGMEWTDKGGRAIEGEGSRNKPLNGIIKKRKGEGRGRGGGMG